RVYVHESVEEKFTRMVVEKTKKLRQGSGESPDVDVGSMTAEMQIKKVESQLKEARELGAQILTGGERDGLFFKPTVIKNVDRNFSVVKDETFGPVLPIMTYRTEEEAVAFANDSDYALNAYVWTRDISRGKKIASKIIAGTVNVNESVFSYALPQTPWGGPKESGIGRTHGALGILEMVQVRHVHVNRMASKANNFWWFGYSADKLQLIKALCFVLFGRPLEKLRGLARFIRLFRKVKTL
ncbi:MAG: aldehyde dehydrogenase family protein, partial [Deltaproteobacteria bacterium]|nr:aldehyde dehydrogenase family protein [Deltaproteobacteria bacterium]